jgi:hypothetical protein
MENSEKNADGDLLKKKVLKEISQEYTSIRSEILVWISVQFTLIAITASVTAIALSVFKASSNWPWFSGILLIIVSSLGFLTAFAHSKVTIAGAYISIFHSNRTVWDHLIYSRLKSEWTVATLGFFMPMMVFYLGLYTAIILYPSLSYKDDLGFLAAEVLIIPSLIYGLMLFILWRAGRREPYEKIWKSFKDNEFKRL